MQTKNVYYAEEPDRVMVTTCGDNALVEFPIGVTKVQADDGVQYLAKKVYSLKTRATANLKERIERNYDAWLDMAQVEEIPQTTISDLVEAVNALTDMMLGGNE